MAYDAEGNFVEDPSPYGSPWANDRTGWSGANADALFEKYARSEAGAVGPQTLAKLREMGVSDDAAIEALWKGATGSANPNWAGGSPTGIMRGIWQHAGVLDKLDSPQLQQAQGQEDQSIWAGQQTKDSDFGPLGMALGIGGSIFGAPYLGSLFGALTGNFNPISLLSAGIGLGGGFDVPVDGAMDTWGDIGGLGGGDTVFSGSFDPTLPDGGVSQATGGLRDALMRGGNYGGSFLNSTYSTPGVGTSTMSSPSMFYDAGALGSGTPVPTIPLDGGWSLDRLWSGAKDIYNNPATKLASQAMKLVGGGADQQRTADSGLAAFNAQLAALIAAANANNLRSQGGQNLTFGAGQAVAPDQRAVYLRGSTGQAGNPDATVAAMGKPAPAAPQFASSGVGGTPVAPMLPSSQQGAVRLPSRPRMYA